MADYKKTVIDDILVGMYYYILDELTAQGKDNQVTGLTSCIESISFNPFLELGDVSYSSSPFDTQRYLNEVWGSSTCPTVYRIKEFKGKDKELKSYDIQSEYNSLPDDYETRLLFYPYRYFILTDYINPPLLLQPQYMQSYNGKWKFKVHIALSQTSKYIVFSQGYKFDSVGNLEGIVNNNPLLLPVASNQYSAWITSQGNTFAQSNLLGLMENQLTNKLANRNVAIDSIQQMTSGAIDFAKWSIDKNLTSGKQGREGLFKIFNGAIGGLEKQWQNNQKYSLKEYEINSLALAKKQDYLNTPNVLKSIGNDTVFNLSNARRKVDLIEYAMNYQKQSRIEKYYKRYGYKINDYGIPDYKSRQYYNFVKTINCDIDSQRIPHGDILALQEIFNSGVTFWHIDNGAEIKNYNVENMEI